MVWHVTPARFAACPASIHFGSGADAAAINLVGEHRPKVGKRGLGLRDGGDQAVSVYVFPLTASG